MELRSPASKAGLFLFPPEKSACPPGTKILDCQAVQNMLDTLASWFTAIGTVAVAIMAIWGDAIRSRVAGPRLTITLRPRGDANPRNDGTRSIYHHVIVENNHGWSAAEAVRVLVVDIAKRGPDGSFFPQPPITPLQLSWAFPQFQEILPTIPSSGPARTCDLGYLDEGSQRFRLSTYIFPNNFPGAIIAGEAIRVVLIAAAQNGQSRRLHVEISWDGKWSNDLDEMQRHLVVKEVPSAAAPQ
jgi:hypothetical protein